MKKQKIIIMLLITAMALCILMPKSNAALQSNGDTAKTDYIDNWIVNIRKMESVGETLGLSETINSDLTSSSGSNNLDIHMEKNTEYGAIAILSASSYGNPNTITDGATTTGNETGIVMKIGGEYVAAASNNGFSYSSIYNATSSKYRNVYNNSNYVAKIGDATNETSGWHGGQTVSNLSFSYRGGKYGTETYYGGLIRANSSTIFSCFSGNTSTAYSRAIMICGEGI